MPRPASETEDLRLLRARVLREALVVLAGVVVLGALSARYDLPRVLADRSQGSWDLLDDASCCWPARTC